MPESGSVVLQGFQVGLAPVKQEHKGLVVEAPSVMEWALVLTDGQKTYILPLSKDALKELGEQFTAPDVQVVKKVHLASI